MTDAQKLEKIISRAVENGWEWYTNTDSEVIVGHFKNMDGKLVRSMYNDIIFDHDFCKAYFPTAKCLGCIQSNEELENWQYQIQQLALSDNRIEYLWQFYNEEV